MKRYLVFDSSCYACSSLARTIAEAAAGKLETISIESEQAQRLLSQAYPNGWEYQPYLVTLKQDKVSASTGYKMAWQLGMLLGPQKGWQVYSLAQQYKVKLASGGQKFSSQKRKFLRSAAIFGGTLFFVGSGFPNLRTLLAAKNKENNEFKPKLSILPQGEARALGTIVKASDKYKDFKAELGSDFKEGNAVALKREGSSGEFLVSIPIKYRGNSRGAAFTVLMTREATGKAKIKEAVAFTLEDTTAGHRGRIWHNGKLSVDVTLDDNGTVLYGAVLNARQGQVGQTNLSVGQNLVAKGQAATNEFLEQLKGRDSSRVNALSFDCVLDCLRSSDGPGYFEIALVAAGCAIPCSTIATCAPCILGILGAFAPTIDDCIARCF